MTKPTVDKLTEAVADFAKATATAPTHADRIEAARVLHEALTGDPLTPERDDDGATGEDS